MEDGRPYKVWKADLLECPDCGHQLITGYGNNPVSEHYQPDFADWYSMVTHTVIGCPKVLP
jgi:hypothetical protein